MKIGKKYKMVNVFFYSGINSVLTRIFYTGVYRTHREAKRGSWGQGGGVGSRSQFLDTVNLTFYSLSQVSARVNTLHFL